MVWRKRSVENLTHVKERYKRDQKGRKRKVERNWEKERKKRGEKEEKKKKRGRREKISCDYKSSIIKREISDLGGGNKLED